MSSEEFLDTTFVKVNNNPFKLRTFYEEKLYDRTIRRLNKIDQHYSKILKELFNNVDEMNKELDNSIKTLERIEFQKIPQFDTVHIVDVFDRTKRYTYDSEDAYMSAIDDCNYMVEIIGNQGQNIKPVFDIDSYEPIDIDNEILRIQSIPHFKDCKVVYATREPRQEMDKTRYSYHIYVIGCKIRAENLKELFMMMKLNEIDYYDRVIYNNYSILYAPFTSSKVDKYHNIIKVPPMIPVDCSVFDCCASYIREDWKDINEEFDVIRQHRETIQK